MTDLEVSRDRLLTAPYADVGLLVAYSAGGGATLGSFVRVGPNDFLTVTHATFDPATRQPYSRIDFFLGVDFDGTTGQFTGSNGATYRGTLETMPWPVYTWTPATGSILGFADRVFADGDNTTLAADESTWDVALVGISQLAGRGDAGLALDPLALRAPGALAIGYPSRSVGQIKASVDAERTVLAGIDVWEGAGVTRPGNSGGPLILAGRVIGVSSAGTPGESATWASLRATYADITREIAANDRLLDPALRPAQRDLHDFTALADATAQTLDGFTVADRLSGGDGDDTLRGFGGADLLTGGRGRDTFAIDGPADPGAVPRITDFKSRQDTLLLDLDGVPGLNLGALPAGHFAKNRPRQPDDLLVYAKGTLYYDADGSGGGFAPVPLVEIGKITARDIRIVDLPDLL
jgi:Ca2+-binding RTX toxin-like protein